MNSRVELVAVEPWLGEGDAGSRTHGARDEVCKTYFRAGLASTHHPAVMIELHDTAVADAAVVRACVRTHAALGDSGFRV